MEMEIRYDIATNTVTEVPYDRPVPMVPEAVDMAQARLALLHAGVTASMVAGELAEMPSPQREAAEIEWEYRTTVRRQSPLVQTLGLALGLDDQQIDDLFRLAASL